ncbi:hypothetical protein YBT020_28469 (plasmid) [Bacillus thuringiensis serovar finitimus YBT-020]|nr:hypothetical protein YBT020_28469 [Bacillus thuringiensis serovar finitimus YBT-020]
MLVYLKGEKFLENFILHNQNNLYVLAMILDFQHIANSV